MVSSKVALGEIAETVDLSVSNNLAISEKEVLEPLLCERFIFIEEYPKSRILSLYLTKTESVSFAKRNVSSLPN